MATDGLPLPQLRSRACGRRIILPTRRSSGSGAPDVLAQTRCRALDITVRAGYLCA